MDSCRPLTKKQPVAVGKAARVRQLQAYAADMRRCPTDSETLLYRALTPTAVGTRFVRQHVIGDFVVDLFSRASGVIVEVNGGYHRYRGRSDRRRRSILAASGYRVLDVSATDVNTRMPAVVRRVSAAVAKGRAVARLQRAAGKGRK